MTKQEMNSIISKNAKNKMMMVSKPSQIHNGSQDVEGENKSIQFGGIKSRLDSEIGKK